MKKSSLMCNYTKEQLAERVLIQERNIQSLRAAIDQQYKNAMQILNEMNLFNERYKKTMNSGFVPETNGDTRAESVGGAK